MRLTKKSDYHFEHYIPNTTLHYILNKLGQLEDILESHNIETLEELDSLLEYAKQSKQIKEELGIDLITLFKALQDGIWVKKTIVENREIKNLFFFYEDVNLYKDRLYACPVDIYDERVCIYQYGKTWALTKEELE